MSLKLFIALVVTVLIGGLVALAGSQGGVTFGAMPVFLICGIMAFGINWLAFIPANAAKTEKYYDLTGSFTYLSLMIIAGLLSAPLDARSSIIALMVVIWAVRLGSFLFLRIRDDGGDQRFDEIKKSPARFFLTWTLQGIWVLLTAASALVIITNSTRLPLDIFAYVGIALWVIGFAIEVISDKQKREFRKSPENKGRFISSGLWAWSRHPNYFGEILLWFGVTVVSLPVLTGWQWVTIISPIFVAFLIIRISGIPKLEANAKKKWGDEKAYQEYVDSVPLLIPKPPKG
ncbi:DUF1295 domain-containing protein [Parasphingorhabdus cellanae]|uniref:DUF1295 domain-containing protein n=1 Tax=Parasphingorhabdus cellanae TaxID=2806553 RepID=A0ABX7T2H9_9SPHN|nr:DUF1295 domain-containing protein [Parasphingorhabdus cellanae]QTD55763.1 DUF1295 domain-containing protein [Parasphingorhabdus cellanae]